MPDIVRQEHDRHATAPQLAPDGVAIAQGLGQPLLEITHERGTVRGQPSDSKNG